eukprot:CAMPEP_0172635632 /NCGR_PEP_ID=MMETSP1068-20121228/200410_1 /TAXON_ID=35684 /ORGANISM="Pseudopedinella elastica, Strain CCMP716" /LENGTH=467 /DNA_ID=CAMNT_0013447909 /DNA_START=100 /DNA_END=1500 /DNA_ORIENTATION=-
MAEEHLQTGRHNRDSMDQKMAEAANELGKERKAVAAQEVQQLKQMFPDWDEDTLVLVIAHSHGLEESVQLILIAGSPETYRSQLNDERKEAIGGELKGKPIVVHGTGRKDLDGQRGVAIDWRPESNSRGAYYKVKMESGTVVGLRPSCVREFAFPVDERSVGEAIRICQIAITSMLIGDIEGAISKLKGPGSPPTAWKHHQGVGKETWAAYQFTLGTAYCERIIGNKTANLDQAIKFYSNCLHVYTRESYPMQWAEVKNNLATAYGERTVGDRALNLTNAAQCYEDALKVYTKDKFPNEWAMVQANLATTYREKSAVLMKEVPEGDTEEAKDARDYAGDSLEEAIKHYEKSLEVFGQDKHPEQWSLIQNNLAQCYSDRIQGDHDENMEKSLEHYEAALAAIRSVRASGEGFSMTVGAAHMRQRRDTTPHISPFNGARDGPTREKPTLPPTDEEAAPGGGNGQDGRDS